MRRWFQMRTHDVQESIEEEKRPSLQITGNPSQEGQPVVTSKFYLIITTKYYCENII
jgi:hypothetical protein